MAGLELVRSRRNSSLAQAGIRLPGSVGRTDPTELQRPCRRGGHASRRAYRQATPRKPSRRTANNPSSVSAAAMTPNPSFQGTAGKLRLPVPSALRAPAAGYLKRWASRLYTGSTRTPLRYNISAYEGEQ